MSTPAPLGSPDGTDALLALARSVLAGARDGEQVEVFVGRSSSTTVRAYDGDVESLTSADGSGVGIRVIVDGRQGFAHAGTLDPEVVAEVLADARDNATFGEPDQWNGLAVPDGVEPIEQQLWDDAVVRATPARKVELALDLEGRVRGLDPRVRGVRTAIYGDAIGEAAVATTAGIEVAWRATHCSASVVALADADGETKTGVGSASGRDPDALDLGVAAADAVRRAVEQFGAAPVPSTSLTVVLDPRTAATVVGIAAGMLTGERVVKGRSPFADRLGEAIASPLLSFVDDPTDPASMGADTYDGEGLACRRNELVRGGVLSQFLHNSYTGRRSGSGSTASAVRGIRSTPGVGLQVLVIEPGLRSFDELVASVDHGVVVRSMTGLHSGVNAVSGDFSVGIEGHMIRGGSVAEPVREVTIASTVQRLLLAIREVGADFEWLPGGTGSCSLVIDDVSLSGT